MKLRVLAVLLVIAILGTGSADAAMFSLAFNNETVDFWGGFHLGKDDQVFLGGRYLYESDQDSKMPAFVVTFESKPQANDAFALAIGLQALSGEAANVDVEGVAVGGDVEWTPPNWKGFYVGGRLYYGPEVFCFGDTENLFEYAVRGGYKINETMGVFLEYASFEADVAGAGTVNVADGILFGFKARF
jgi:hypothetical protein